MNAIEVFIVDFENGEPTEMIDKKDVEKLWEALAGVSGAVKVEATFVTQHEYDEAKKLGDSLA